MLEREDSEDVDSERGRYLSGLLMLLKFVVVVVSSCIVCVP